jgi:hypothetical protein
MNRSAFDALAVFQNHRIDEAIVRAHYGLRDLALGALHAALLGVAAQNFAYRAGVEMIGVGDIRQRRTGRYVGRRRHELAARRCHRIQ